jgi:hypothetical protein
MDQRLQQPLSIDCKKRFAVSARVTKPGLGMVDLKIALTLILFAALFLAIYFTAIPG